MVDEKKGLHFNKQDGWVKPVGSRAKIGISDHAQEELGDIEFVELPDIGKEVKQLVEGESQSSKLAVVESIKATTEVYSPISGEVEEVNEDLEMRPEQINEEPYEDGWICIVKPSNMEDEIENLMTLEEYEEFIRSK